MEISRRQFASSSRLERAAEASKVIPVSVLAVSPFSTLLDALLLYNLLVPPSASKSLIASSYPASASLPLICQTAFSETAVPRRERPHAMRLHTNLHRGLRPLCALFSPPAASCSPGRVTQLNINGICSLSPLISPVPNIPVAIPSSHS